MTIGRISLGIAVVGVGAVGLGAAALAAGAPPPKPAGAPAAFAQCAVCHSAAKGAPHGIGPNLWGVAGAKAGSRPGYTYSPALKGSGVMWNKATLTRWLVDTQKVAPGTVMPNQALQPAQRDAIVAYLVTLK